MKLPLHALAALALFCFGSAHAAIRYTEARIVEIETSDTSIFMFLEVLSGDAPPVGNGGTNSLPNRPYLTLATNATDVGNRKQMLSAAFLAYSTDSVVRLRWDDASATPDKVEYMLVRK